MPLTDTLGELAKKLPEAALPYAIRLVQGALDSDDPAWYLARRVEADAAHAAAQETARKALGE